jgi:hypothetical protein
MRSPSRSWPRPPDGRRTGAAGGAVVTVIVPRGPPPWPTTLIAIVAMPCSASDATSAVAPLRSLAKPCPKTAIGQPPGGRGPDGTNRLKKTSSLPCACGVPVRVSTGGITRSVPWKRGDEKLPIASDPTTPVAASAATGSSRAWIAGAPSGPAPTSRPRLSDAIDASGNTVRSPFMPTAKLAGAACAERICPPIFSSTAVMLCVVNTLAATTFAGLIPAASIAVPSRARSDVAGSPGAGGVCMNAWNCEPATGSPAASRTPIVTITISPYCVCCSRNSPASANTVLVAGSNTIRSSGITVPYGPPRVPAPLTASVVSSSRTRNALLRSIDAGSIAPLNGIATRGCRLKPSSVLSSATSWQSDGRSAQSGAGRFTRMPVRLPGSGALNASLGNGLAVVADQSNSASVPAADASEGAASSAARAARRTDRTRGNLELSCGPLDAVRLRSPWARCALRLRGDTRDLLCEAWMRAGGRGESRVRPADGVPGPPRGSSKVPENREALGWDPPRRALI